ncbi:MAG: sugar phosphate isomerase/epimerase family protein [Promethearchaeota archaeon]
MNATEQLSLITDEIGQDIEKILPTLKKYHINAVELRRVWYKNIIDFTDDDLERLRQVLDENNFQVSNIAGPIFKCYAPWTGKHDPSSNSYSRNVERSREKLERAIEIAKHLGSKNVRVFGYLYPVNFIKFLFSPKLPEISDEHWQILIDDLTRFVDLAKTEKINVVLENEAISLINTWQATVRILGDIDDDYFKLILDPGNFFMCGEIHDPQTYLKKKDRVAHHHIKDGTTTLGIRHFTVVGEGVLNYQAYFNAWVEAGFEGYFSLETHVLTNRVKVSYKSLENMARMLEIASVARNKNKIVD